MYSLDHAPLYWPKAKTWMWNYCIYLGPFTNFRGENYDLGIYLGPHERPSAAIVYGDTPGDYLSGPLAPTVSDVYTETYKRAKALKLVK